MSDSEWYYEVDDEVIRECERIESAHNTPVKKFNSLFRSSESFSSFDFPSPTKLSNPPNAVPGSTWASFNPTTPSRGWDISPSTPASRGNAAKRTFDIHGPPSSPEQSPTPRRKLVKNQSTNLSTRKKMLPVVDVDSDEEDSRHVENELLTDTDVESPIFGPSPISTQNSLSSIGSNSDWTNITSFSSFRSPVTSQSISGDSESPTKYRKLSDPPEPNTNSQSSSARSESVKSVDIDYILSATPPPPSPSPSRNNSQGTSERVPLTPPDDDDVSPRKLPFSDRLLFPSEIQTLKSPSFRKQSSSTRNDGSKLPAIDDVFGSGATLTSPSRTSSRGASARMNAILAGITPPHAGASRKLPIAGGPVTPSRNRSFPSPNPPSQPSPAHSGSSKPMKIGDVSSSSLSCVSSNKAKGKAVQPIAVPFSPAPTSAEDDTALKAFLSGPLGQALDPVYIAHDAEVVALMDKEKIPWGAQWEVARGVTMKLWDWEKVKAKIPQLRASKNGEIAHKVWSIIMDKPLPKPADNTIWEELDREQDAIMEGRDRGLGLQGEWRGEPDWYGGRVQQLARIVGEKGVYRIRLEPMEKKKSHRLARYLGSRRVIQLRIPKDLILKENGDIKRFMQQKGILLGRVFVPLYSKDHNTYLVESDENYERRGRVSCGDNLRKSFKEIVNWHNRLDLNVDQPISKYVTRFALALSTSIPVLEFLEENIIHIPDEIGDYPGEGKPEAKYILTDGCGMINEAGLRKIAVKIGYFGLPTAIQGRFEGGKGLWILHPTNTDSEPMIWIRASQRKIVYQRPLHRAHRIFDLVSTSQPSTSVSLSKQSIMNLSENGVSEATLTKLMKQALIDEVKPLMQWEGPKAMELLWGVINTFNSISKSRLTRLAAGWSRALGLVGREWGREEIEIEKDDGTPSTEGEYAGSYTGRSPSGEPASLAELTVELLQSDFTPMECKLVKDKLRYLLEHTISSIVDKFSIPLPESRAAFIVPDPLGVLGPGQVYYRCSQGFLNPETQMLCYTLTGKVLVGRYPIRLASDIQKVEAVDRPELSRWPDVLIVSIQEPKSFASDLAGGDYDGDVVFILCEKALVEPFRNSLVKDIPANLMADNFKKYPEQVKAFSKRVSTMSPMEAQKCFADVLMMSLDDSKKGLYSNFQEYAIFKYGYGAACSERLAYIFNALLDSSKTGDRLKDGIFEDDQKQFGQTIPNYKSNEANTRYILHTLQRVGKETGDELLAKYDDLTRTPTEIKDNVLKQPYATAIDWAHREYDTQPNPWRKMLVDDLACIRSVVDTAYDTYREVMKELAVKNKDMSSPVKKQTKPKNLQRKPDPKAKVHELYGRKVEGVKFFPNIEELKASYAYTLDSNFGFTVAFRRLCTMKAEYSRDGLAPITRTFDEAKTIPSNFTKTVTRLRAQDL
ncbi:hypothetical protein H0H87_000946 [Tephrocybe sp. NHM501043]|nr:hypothetical protein H0H87_000946 [Tephrocybe sp. NHM501043]